MVTFFLLRFCVQNFDGVNKKAGKQKVRNSRKKPQFQLNPNGHPYIFTLTFVNIPVERNGYGKKKNVE